MWPLPYKGQGGYSHHCLAAWRCPFPGLVCLPGAYRIDTSGPSGRYGVALCLLICTSCRPLPALPHPLCLCRFGWGMHPCSFPLRWWPTGMTMSFWVMCMMIPSVISVTCWAMEYGHIFKAQPLAVPFTAVDEGRPWHCLKIIKMTQFVFTSLCI